MPPSLTPENFDTFGALLRFLRERVQLTQRELAALIGYHFSYISYLENNTRAVDDATLLGRFVPALELEEEPAWTARLLELSRRRKSQTDASAGGAHAADTLPPSLTPIIGREAEAGQLRELLLDPRCQLVTIAGPPGVGKTRLGVHVARGLAPAFPGGVCFVDLTAVRSPDLLVPALALALGVPPSSRGPVEETVKTALAGRQALLLLDNFEQIVDAAPQLLPLLGISPPAKMLVTSREPLRVRGEQEFHLGPLAVPAENQRHSPAEMQGFASVRLFLERARAVKPEFALDERNSPHVAEICRRLDGLPLAIELASARVRALSVSAMLEQFDRRFEWLSHGARDLPIWRQTLQGAIEWSYLLLGEKERTLFRRLAVFSGGWTLEAAEAVCGDETACPRGEVLGLLIQLANKSLVVPDPEADRYFFLETLREFASLELEGSGELETLRERHFAYCLGFVQAAQPQLEKGKDQYLWLDRTEAEHSNLRAALAWVTADPARSPQALRFGRSIHVFWLVRSYVNEARYWLGRILGMDTSPSETRAELLRFASDYASTQGDYAQAEALEQEAMEISRALGDEAGIFFSLDGMAVLAGMQGNYARAAEILEQVLAYRRRNDDRMRLTLTLNNLAIATRRLGNLERARSLFEESVQVNRLLEDRNSLAHALHGLAEVHVGQGAYAQALQFQRESAGIRHKLGDMKGMTFSLNSLAQITERLGRHPLAATLEGAAARLRQELGMPISPATRRENDELLARLRTALGDAAFEDSWREGQALAWEALMPLVNAVAS
jgi:predicted ATPase